jgi:hypothetical protein
MRAFARAALRRDVDGGLYCGECWDEEYGPSEPPSREPGDGGLSAASAARTAHSESGQSTAAATRSGSCSGAKAAAVAAAAAEGVAVLSATMPAGAGRHNERPPPLDASLLGPGASRSSAMPASLSATMPASVTSNLSDLNLSLSSSADSSVHFGSSDDDDTDLLPQSGSHATSTAQSSARGGVEAAPLAAAAPTAPAIPTPRTLPPLPLPVPGPAQLSRDPADYVLSKRRSERLVRTQGRIGAQPFVIEELADCEVLLLDTSGQVDLPAARCCPPPTQSPQPGACHAAAERSHEWDGGFPGDR